MTASRKQSLRYIHFELFVFGSVLFVIGSILMVITGWVRTLPTRWKSILNVVSGILFTIGSIMFLAVPFITSANVPAKVCSPVGRAVASRSGTRSVSRG